VETVLSASASAANGLETTDDSLGPISEVPDEPIALDADGLPIEEPAPTVQKCALRVKRAAAQVSGSGTVKWASRNVRTRWEYAQDCTNFVSKALYHGGKMKTRQGGRSRPSVAPCGRSVWASRARLLYVPGPFPARTPAGAGGVLPRRHGPCGTAAVTVTTGRNAERGARRVQPLT
jgi:hypothetical protein